MFESRSSHGKTLWPLSNFKNYKFRFNNRLGKLQSQLQIVALKLNKVQGTYTKQLIN